MSERYSHLYKKWNVIIYQDEIPNTKVLEEMLKRVLNKKQPEISMMIQEFQNNGNLFLGRYVSPIAETIKYDIQVYFSKIDVNVYIALEPENI